MKKNNQSCQRQTQEEEQKSISFQPFLRITRTRTVLIASTGGVTDLAKDLYEPQNKPQESKENEPRANQACEKEDNTKQEKDLSGQKDAFGEIGLDCSGQGECQPGIVPSDSDEMQRFLMTHTQEVNKRSVRKRQK